MIMNIKYPKEEFCKEQNCTAYDYIIKLQLRCASLKNMQNKFERENSISLLERRIENERQEKCESCLATKYRRFNKE